MKQRRFARPIRHQTGLRLLRRQSLNLGTLQSITVQRDNEGNAPDWFLDRILVDSFRYGVSKQATFQRWIGTSPVTRPLV
jgi:hypothetical protein